MNLEIERRYFAKYSRDAVLGVLQAQGWNVSARQEQRNHYFKPPQGSVRTRWERDAYGLGGSTFLVVKGSSDAIHGDVRSEYQVRVDSTIEELDQALELAGIPLESKWSRRRTVLVKDGTTICLDENDGYGFVVEIERIASTQAETDESIRIIEELADWLVLSEIPKKKLAAMYAYYVANWEQYYQKGGLLPESVMLSS